MDYRYAVLHPDTPVRAFCCKVMEEINLKREKKSASNSKLHIVKTRYQKDLLLYALK